MTREEDAEIRAALLAACQAVWRDWSNHPQANDVEWDGYATLQLVKSAIEKATGEKL